MISAFSLVKQQWESTPQLLHFFWSLRFSAFGVSSTHRTDWHDYNQQEEAAVSKVNLRPVAVSGCLRGRGRTNKKGSSTRTVVPPLPGLSGTHRALLHVFLHTGRQRAQLLFTIRHFHVLFLNGDTREGDVCCILQAHNYFFLADKSFNANCSAFNVTCFYFVYLTASFSSIAPPCSGRSSILCHHVSKHTNKTAINVILNLSWHCTFITRHFYQSESRHLSVISTAQSVRPVWRYTGDQYSQRNTKTQSTFNLI